MRSGQPDSIDLMVALNYAHMAIDLIGQGLFNRLVALRNGVYTNVPIDTVLESTKRVDVDALYDVKQYRPKLRHMDGKPMFLY
jgi:6-phosphofructokinase 1